MKHEVTFSCGHKGTVQLYGSRVERERKIWYFENRADCPECEEKARVEAAAKALAQAKADGLPELEGTEKQVAWAVQIRARILGAYNEYMSEAERRYDDALAEVDAAQRDAFVECNAKDRRQLMDCMEYIMQNKTRAGWWINTRDDDMFSIWIERQMESLASFLATREMERAEATDPAARDAKGESTMKPDTLTKQGVAEVTVTRDEDDAAKGTIAVRYEKDDDFRALVKKLNYRWDKEKIEWSRSIGVMRGPITDRAAELVNALLRAGFAVRCYDDAVRAMATDASFTPERVNWIGATNDGKLSIHVKGDMLYRRASGIKGARWDSQTQTVNAPVSSFAEVEDFAEAMDYAFTPKALELIQARKDALAAAKVVSAAEPAEVEQKDGLSEILESSRAVLDDLKD